MLEWFFSFCILIFVCGSAFNQFSANLMKPADVDILSCIWGYYDIRSWSYCLVPRSCWTLVFICVAFLLVYLLVPCQLSWVVASTWLVVHVGANLVGMYVLEQWCVIASVIINFCNSFFELVKFILHQRNKYIFEKIIPDYAGNKWISTKNIVKYATGSKYTYENLIKQRT